LQVLLQDAAKSHAARGIGMVARRGAGWPQLGGGGGLPGVEPGR